jgi:DNA-binding response OmpR family regulator
MAKEILLVDDEPNLIVPIQFLMEQQGYRVTIAERGEDEHGDLWWETRLRG